MRTPQSLQSELAARSAAPRGGGARGSLGSRGFRLARIAGIEIFVDWSLLIIFFLIVTSLAGGVFPAWQPQWSSGFAFVVATVAALLFFSSVLAHELSHSLVGRAFGIPVHRITLFIFGGVAQLEEEPRNWRAEFWMAIAGPLMSLAIGALCLGLAGLLAGSIEPATESPARVFATLGPLPTVLVWLGQVNIVLALFNLVPGFPLDGGRVLRAVTWGLTGNLRRATRLASAAGQAFAWLLIATGVAMILGIRVPLFGAGPIGGLWLAFIGWFLNNAAMVSYRQLLTREALDDVPVSRIMTTRFESVPPQMPVSQFVDDYLLRSAQRAFPVVDDGRFVGLVCQREIDRLGDASQPTTAVGAVMRPVHELSVVGPEDDALEVLGMLAEREVNQLPVVQGGRILGLLQREDILRWLALVGRRGSTAPAAEAPRS